MPALPAISEPRVSVITVCFNALQVLPATLSSLKTQTAARHAEWIVVDGASTDGSVAWLQAQQPDVLVSEPDGGIYDAMNKAIDRARGEWIYFLNAGDAFADNDVLADLIAAIESAPDTELLYGDVLYFGDRGERLRRFHWLSRRRLVFGDLCHQAALMRRSLFDRFGRYDLALRWNADFDWFVRAFRGGAKLCYVHRTIARFHDAGSHVQASQRSEAERRTVRARYLPLSAWRLGNLALRVEHRIRRLLGQSV